MEKLSRETILNDVIKILYNMTSDWEFDDEISNDTRFFNDLGFESIDAVALVSAIEEYCKRTLPFAEFLTNLGEKGIEELTVGQIVDFVYQNL